MWSSIKPRGHTTHPLGEPSGRTRTTIRSCRFAGVKIWEYPSVRPVTMLDSRCVEYCVLYCEDRLACVEFNAPILECTLCTSLLRNKGVAGGLAGVQSLYTTTKQHPNNNNIQKKRKKGKTREKSKSGDKEYWTHTMKSKTLIECL